MSITKANVLSFEFSKLARKRVVPIETPVASIPKTTGRKKTQPVIASTGVKEICDFMKEASHNHGLWEVFRDFLLMGATSISNSVDRRDRKRMEAREAEYMRTVKGYKPEAVVLFPKMLGSLTMALEESSGGFDDVLGKVFEELELQNKWIGQYFTPYALCQVSAEMLLDGSLEKTIATKGYVTLHEPACGSGAMIIAFADAMRRRGFNPQRQLHVTAVDIDPRSVHMTYLQLSLLGIPAEVIVGNTLTLEMTDSWVTPMHVMGGWWYRLLHDRKRDARFAAIRELRTNHVTAQAGS